tara:strand:- start:449 stop:673 length:225 start_codon:yes stop_codon:yes gene_type:complete
MKQKIKNELLAAAAIDVIKKAAMAALLLISGVLIGYTFANKQHEPCPVGFATVKDMMFLVDELRVCKGYTRFDL